MTKQREYNPVVNVVTWLYNVRESTRNDMSYALMKNEMVVCPWPYDQARLWTYLKTIENISF